MEDKVIESRIHAYLSLGKTAQYIRVKLAQKKFDKTLVERFYPKSWYNQKSRDISLSNRKIIQKWEQNELQKISYVRTLSKISDARKCYRRVIIWLWRCEYSSKKAPELRGKYSQEQIIQNFSQKGFRMADIYTVFRRR